MVTAMPHPIARQAVAATVIATSRSGRPRPHPLLPQPLPWKGASSRISRQQTPPGSTVVATRAGLSQAVEDGLEDYFDAGSVKRVQESLKMLNSGREFTKEWPTGLQVSGSYISGLTAEPWHDPHDSPLDLDWWVYLEKHSHTIREEFLAAISKPEELESQGNSIWVPAVDENALKYGKEWRTLVLQDRGRWEETNIKLFPKTTELVKASKAPSVEVFFAKQPPGTHIEPHTDNANFIMTGHLAIVVPEGDLWIKCGNETKHWEEGKSIVMDTSFMHSTANSTEGDRYVLIIRFWHPEVSPLERLALRYIFDAVDYQDAKVAKKNLKKAYKSLGIRKRM